MSDKQTTTDPQLDAILPGATRCGVCEYYYSAEVVPALRKAEAELVKREQEIADLKAKAASDEQRWELIDEALTTGDLKSDLSRLVAVGVTVNSRKPMSEADIARTVALFPAEIARFTRPDQTQENA